jgi:hypothetical protein
MTDSYSSARSAREGSGNRDAGNQFYLIRLILKQPPLPWLIDPGTETAAREADQNGDY